MRTDRQSCCCWYYINSALQGRGDSVADGTPDGAAEDSVVEIVTMATPTSTTDKVIPSWLSKDFLERALRNNDPGISVDTFDAHPNLELNNYSSTIFKVTVTYRDCKNNQTKESLIVKCLPANESRKTIVEDMSFFGKEITAYSKLFPDMRSLTETPLVSPKFYDTDRPNTIILEDLSPRGFKPVKLHKRLDLDHAFLVMKTLGRFHGLSFAVVQRDPTILNHFPESYNSEKRKESDAVHLPRLYKNVASAVATWPGYERFSEKLVRRCDEIRSRVKENLIPKKGAFNVLNHGDCWLSNMLFRYNENTDKVEDLCLIDIQFIRYNSPAMDIIYFLSSSLADGLRDNNENKLLEVYYRALTETLESVGVDPRIYSLEDLKRDLDEKAPFGFQTGILTVAAITADPELFAANPVNMKFGKGFPALFQKHLLYYEKRGVL